MDANILLDGFHAIVDHAWTLTCILLILIWGHIVIRGMLPKVLGDLTAAEYFSLSAAGWILPVGTWSVLLFLGSSLFGEFVGKIIAVGILLLALFLVPKKKGESSLPLTTLILFFIISLILRFAFLQKAIFPSYFDSAEHYRIIREITENISTPTGASGSYYHVGYHVITSALVNPFQLNIIEVMLSFGQVLLAVLPLSLFLILKRETDSNAAGLFSVLLAGFGWHMPAHLLNWGKYPALLSLVAIHFVIILAYILWRSGQFQTQKPRFYLLLGFGILVSALIHTRSLIFFVILFVAFMLSSKSEQLSAQFRYIVFGLFLGIIVVEIIVLRQSSVFNPLLEGYAKADLWMLTLVLFLSFFAIRFHTRLTFTLFLTTILLLLTLFVPLTLPGYGTQTLLDRPYIQMVMYLPLSILGGLGLSGLTQSSKRLFLNSSLPARLIALILSGLVILNAGLQREFYPSDCCQLITHDDLAAITWLDETLSPEAKILIASTSLYVTAFEAPETRAGADGGVWITPLISRQTIPAWQGLSFDQLDSHVQLCNQPVDYIYVGGMPQSFNVDSLNATPNWYQPVFSLPLAKIYQVVGCEMP